MKRCDNCGCIAFLDSQATRGGVAVDTFICRCGRWEDYRFRVAPTLTPSVLAARHERYKAKERIRARNRYRRRKAQGLA
jgi:hypothetical protein